MKNLAKIVTLATTILQVTSDNNRDPQASRKLASHEASGPIDSNASVGNVDGAIQIFSIVMNLIQSKSWIRQSPKGSKF